MTDKNNKAIKLVPFHFEDFYPTPKKRIDMPLPAAYSQGQLVEILIGPAKGKIGVVVVDRNGNYEDFEPYTSKESIAVAVDEKIQLADELEKIVIGLNNYESLYKPVVRWFDGPEQLRPIKKDDKLFSN